MSKANYSLRLQPSLKAAAERLAAADGTSLNQFINIAVAEKLSAIETETFFRARAERRQPGAFRAFLEQAGAELPSESDILPENWRPQYNATSANLEGNMADTVDGIDLNSFSSGHSMKELGKANCGDVPNDSGVYVVVRTAPSNPQFLPVSRAGWFKGRDPSYPKEIVEAEWVPGATIVYIGKASGHNGLRQRVGQLVQFAYGHPVAHEGGRLLWHLPDWEELLIHWRVCSGESASIMEAELIERFRQEHAGKRPYANRRNGKGRRGFRHLPDVGT